MSIKIRSYLEQQLKELLQEVWNLGIMVEQAIDRAITTLKNRDLEGAKKIVEEDMLINQKRFKLEEKCFQLVATQQPIGTDLRFLMAALNIIFNLERIGDYAKGIAKISLMIGEQPLISPLVDISKMADKAKEMLHRSLLCLLNRDCSEVFRICSDEHDKVDTLYRQICRELLLLMNADSKNINQGIYLTWVAHRLERIADQATNIAERVYFMVTGKLEENLGVSRY